MTPTTEALAAECALFEAWVRSIWDLGATDDPLELQGRLLDAWKARAALEAQAGATEPKPVDWTDPRAWLVTAALSPGPKAEPGNITQLSACPHCGEPIDVAAEAQAEAKPAPFADPTVMVGTKSLGRPGFTVYDLGPAGNPDSAISQKLIEMGWRPPNAHAQAEAKPAEPVPSQAVLLAEQVLHMELLTERGKRARELARQLLAQAHDVHEGECAEVLRSLASFLGTGGYNAPAVDPAEFRKKILWGIEQMRSPEVPAAAPAAPAEPLQYSPCRDYVAAPAAPSEPVAVPQGPNTEFVLNELRSALNAMLTFFGMDEDDSNKEVFDKARQAYDYAQIVMRPLEPWERQSLEDFRACVSRWHAQAVAKGFDGVEAMCETALPYGTRDLRLVAAPAAPALWEPTDAELDALMPDPAHTYECGPAGRRFAWTTDLVRQAMRAAIAASKKGGAA